MKALSKVTRSIKPAEVEKKWHLIDADGLVVFERLLKNWRAYGTTVIWVEHDLDAVHRLADRVAGLNGRILFDDKPDVLRDADRLLQLFSHRRKSVQAVVRRAA